MFDKCNCNCGIIFDGCGKKIWLVGMIFSLNVFSFKLPWDSPFKQTFEPLFALHWRYSIQIYIRSFIWTSIWTPLRFQWWSPFKTRSKFLHTFHEKCPSLLTNFHTSAVEYTLLDQQKHVIVSYHISRVN